jgi:hypothetical protein
MEKNTENTSKKNMEKKGAKRNESFERWNRLDSTHGDSVAFLKRGVDWGSTGLESGPKVWKLLKFDPAPWLGTPVQFFWVSLKSTWNSEPIFQDGKFYQYPSIMNCSSSFSRNLDGHVNLNPLCSEEKKLNDDGSPTTVCGQGPPHGWFIFMSPIFHTSHGQVPQKCHGQVLK